jgi:hypothetical protein
MVEEPADIPHVLCVDCELVCVDNTTNTVPVVGSEPSQCLCANTRHEELGRPGRGR